MGQASPHVDERGQRVSTSSRGVALSIIHLATCSVTQSVHPVRLPCTLRCVS